MCIVFELAQDNAYAWWTCMLMIVVALAYYVFAFMVIDLTGDSDSEAEVVVGNTSDSEVEVVEDNIYDVENPPPDDSHSTTTFPGVGRRLGNDSAAPRAAGGTSSSTTTAADATSASSKRQPTNENSNDERPAKRKASSERPSKAERMPNQSRERNEQSDPLNVGNYTATNSNGYLPSNFGLYTDGQASKEEAMEHFRKGDIQCYNIKFGFGCFVSLSLLYLELIELFLAGALIVIFFERGCGSSGISVTRTREVLMTSPSFKHIVLLLEGTFGVLGRLWVAMNISGLQDKHGDKIKKGCTHRGLLSLLCINKMMWFENQETGVKFGILVPHGALMFLSSRGGGFDGKLLHSVEGGDNSWLVAFDISCKAN